MDVGLYMYMHSGSEISRTGGVTCGLMNGVRTALGMYFVVLLDNV